MGTENRHLLQDIFSSKSEYQKYLKSAYQFLRKQKVEGASGIVPTYLEIRLNTKIRNQRIYIDKKKYDTLIIELSVEKKTSPRKRQVIKANALIVYGPILGTYEKALADEFAVTEKLFDSK